MNNYFLKIVIIVVKMIEAEGVKGGQKASLCLIFNKIYALALIHHTVDIIYLHTASVFYTLCYT